ncbi:MAG TPA: hypothetical protein VKI18_06605 [Albitalea sp.]|nr:hypothetical protein [Albitalea sp.]
MSLEEFRAWERKCLAEAVTNAARLRSQQSSAAAASSPSTDPAAASEGDETGSADQSGPHPQKG